MTTYNYSFNSTTEYPINPNINNVVQQTELQFFIVLSVTLEKIYINKSCSIDISNNIKINIIHTISGYGYGDWSVQRWSASPIRDASSNNINFNKVAIVNVDPSLNDTITFDMSFNDNSRSISNQYNFPLSTDLSYVRINQIPAVKLNAIYFIGTTFILSNQITTSAYTFIDTSFGIYRCKEGLTTVNTSSSQMYILLPNPAVNVGNLFIIKDKTYNANNNNIVIIAPTNVNINRANTLTINTPGGCVSLLCDGINYIIVE